MLSKFPHLLSVLLNVQKVYTISADVTSESIKEDLGQELSGLPPVDVLINSAGISHTGAFVDMPTKTFDVRIYTTFVQ